MKLFGEGQIKPKPGSEQVINRREMLTAGQVMKLRRGQLDKTLEEVAEETKVRLDYLKALEADEYSIFDNDVFLTGFIKIYANYLELDTQKILALYRRTKTEAPKKSVFATSKDETANRSDGIKINDILSPRTAIILVILLFIGSVLAYLGVQLFNFQKEPLLEVKLPSADITTSEEMLEIELVTDKFTVVTLNDRELPVKENGYFNGLYELQEGMNVLVFKGAKKNNANQQVQLIRRVKYEPPVEPTAPADQSGEQLGEEANPPATETPETNPNDTPEEGEETGQEETPTPAATNFTIEVVDNQAWISITVDEEYKGAAIRDPGYKESFEFVREIRINAGRPASTKLTFNDKIIPLKLGVNTCTLQSGELQCE